MKIFRAVVFRSALTFLLTVTACLTCGAAPRVGSPENPFVLTSTTPTLRWEKVPGADLYALYVSRYPYESKDIVFKNESLKKTFFKVPDGCLVDGERYHWNVTVRKKSEWRDSSEPFYFRVKLNKPTARDWYRQGNAAFEREEYDTALRCYTKLIEMEPDLAEAYHVRGTVYGAKSEYEKALTDFDRAIRLDPDYGEAYYGRAIVYSAQQEYGKAAADITKSKALGFPVNPKMVELLLKVTGVKE
ncbi:MAG: tetratricopeptide repeat protein [Candidatus Ratteibacteria bacterium]|jgi:tetratricopeptide (TPR) repeat protein